MGWFEVEADSDQKILGPCITCFQNVSKDSAKLDVPALIRRLEQTIDVNKPKPKLANGALDDENRMFRLFGYNEGENKPILLTIALDRTLKRNDLTGVPERNHWCITLGIAELLQQSSITGDRILQLLRDEKLIPASYQLALLWTQRKANASDELNPKWTDLKGQSDAVLKELIDRPNVVTFSPTPPNLPYSAEKEPAYAHWKLFLPAGSMIRFVPFTL